MNSHFARSARLAAGLAAITALAPRSAAAHPSVSVVVTPYGRVYAATSRRSGCSSPTELSASPCPTCTPTSCASGPTARSTARTFAIGATYIRVRYWRLTPAGRIEYVTDWIAGHPSDIGFSLMEPADAGRYWVRLTGGEVRLVRRDGTVDVKFQLDAEPVPASWVKAIPGGVLVVRGGSVLELHVDGTARVLAEHLIERTEDFDWLQDSHALMKPWTDPQGRVYVPIYAGQRIVRLSGDGAPPEVVFTSDSGWSPTGGLFEADGTLWIQEWGRQNQPRLRRIDPSGAEQVFGPPG